MSKWVGQEASLQGDIGMLLGREGGREGKTTPDYLKRKYIPPTNKKANAYP